jgi:hypothetical protein
VNVVQVFLLSLPLVSTCPVLCCMCRFNYFRRFCGKLLFQAISCINSHYFCFFTGVNGRGYVLEM